MIKKYITLAALLSAGTALANAATATVETTFSYKNQSGYAVFTSNSIFTDFQNRTYSSSKQTTIGTGSGSTPSFKTTGAVGSYTTNVTNSFIPANVDLTTGSWYINLDYSDLDLDYYLNSSLAYALGTGVKIDKVELWLGAFTYEGNWLRYDHSQNFDAVVNFGSTAQQTFKDQNVSGHGDLTVSGGGTSGGLLSTGFGTGPSQTSLTLTIDESDEAFKFGGSDNTIPGNLKLTFKGATNGTTGSRVGVQKVKLYLSEYDITTAGNVPEPSAFGLLAGLGALALVSARRRK